MPILLSLLLSLGARQLITVEPSATPVTSAQLWEKGDAGWQKVGPGFRVVVGRNGTTPAVSKFEGDGKTPEGLYGLPMLFTRGEVTGYALPTVGLVREDKWIDDPAHPDYNRWIRGPTTARSYENLWLDSRVYDRILVLDYNMDPVVPGKGSAIFFHLWSSPTVGTAGCIATDPDTLESLLKWLRPDSHPMIFIGRF